MSPRRLLERLRSLHGPQGWWPGDDAFEIAVGAILTQRTSWRNAALGIANLRAAGILEPERLLHCDDARLQSLLRPCGFFRTKAERLRHFCRWLQAAGGMKALTGRPTPALRRELLAVHGIGPETADAILLYAFGRPVFVADAYALRLLGRLGLIGKELPTDYESVRRQIEAALGGDSAALNELHALIVRHGQTSCRPVPRCDRCVLCGDCAFPQAALSRPQSATTMQA